MLCLCWVVVFNWFVVFFFCLLECDFWSVFLGILLLRREKRELYRDLYVGVFQLSFQLIVILIGYVRVLLFWILGLVVFVVIGEILVNLGGYERQWFIVVLRCGIFGGGGCFIGGWNMGIVWSLFMKRGGVGEGIFFFVIFGLGEFQFVEERVFLFGRLVFIFIRK